MTRTFQLTFAAFMSFLMSVFMCAVVTAINLGVHHDFAGQWLHAWIRVFPIAFVAVLMFRPIAMRATITLLGPPTAAADARRTPR